MVFDCRRPACQQPGRLLSQHSAGPALDRVSDEFPPYEDGVRLLISPHLQERVPKQHKDVGVATAGVEAPTEDVFPVCVGNQLFPLEREAAELVMQVCRPALKALFVAIEEKPTVCEKRPGFAGWRTFVDQKMLKPPSILMTSPVCQRDASLIR